MTNRTHRSVAIGALGLAFAISACSSAPAAPATSSSAPAAPATSSSAGGAASVAPDVNPDPTASAGTGTSTGGGGGGAMAWCLNTPEEVSKALGVGATTATGTDAPGVGGACLYTLTGGKPVFGVSVVTSSEGVTAFENIVSAPGVESFPGIGDRAILAGPDGPFVVLKGSAIASLGAVAVQSDKARYRTALEELARSAAPRMP